MNFDSLKIQNVRTFAEKGKKIKKQKKNYTEKFSLLRNKYVYLEVFLNQPVDFDGVIVFCVTLEQRKKNMGYIEIPFHVKKGYQILYLRLQINSEMDNPNGTYEMSWGLHQGTIQIKGKSEITSFQFYIEGVSLNTKIKRIASMVIKSYIKAALIGGIPIGIASMIIPEEILIYATVLPIILFVFFVWKGLKAEKKEESMSKVMQKLADIMDEESE